MSEKAGIWRVESRRVEGHFCLCWKERQTVSFVFVTVNRYIPYGFMRAKVSTVILIYSASIFLLLAM